ncbi:HNH endonuclease, partial [Dietzia cinnamea]|nr:HNH endonuclease [Dietzia cinnamea]MCT2144617.1 HNH endonuclease [Dietzia cinnamea]
TAEACAATTPPPKTADETAGSADAAPHSAPAPAPRERMTPAAASRWWQRNKPTDSALEKAILHALHEHLDELLQPPPPF